jgi:hypothetical protein
MMPLADAALDIIHVETYKRCNDGSHAQRDDVAPDRESDVLLDNDNETKYEADGKHNHVPPPGCLFVVLMHVGVMRIIELSSFGGLERPDCIASPE